jgi:heat shock protein HslJ
MNKKTTSIAIILAVIIVGIYFYSSFTGTEAPKAIDRYNATLSGTYLCLPHIGEQNADCKYGLLTDDGKYYALDFNLVPQTSQGIPDHARITAAGIVTPIEMLSTDMWRKYPLTGIFSVTGSYAVIGSLDAKPWTWAEDPKFVLSFAKDGNFSATTDCNSVFGSYTANGGMVSFSGIGMTKKYCEGTRENEFISILSGAQTYSIGPSGELVLGLKPSGTATFR